jgi:hypothetical protein
MTVLAICTRDVRAAMAVMREVAFGHQVSGRWWRSGTHRPSKPTRSASSLSATQCAMASAMASGSGTDVWS